MHTKLAHKYTKTKTYWIKYKFYALPLNTGVSVKIFYLNKMCSKVCVTELLVFSVLFLNKILLQFF